MLNQIDLLIQNGRVFDPAAGEDGIRSIAIRGSRIVPADKNTEVNNVIDASDSYIFPGFIDWHTHLYSWGSGFGINPDLLFSSGVTMAVDMGSAGHANFEALRQELAVRQMKTAAFINVSPIGQAGYGMNEPLDNILAAAPGITELANRYPEQIKGLKLRLSKQIVGDLGMKPLDDALQLSQACGLPLCVHVTNPPAAASEILSKLRTGDIFSHVYHQIGDTILNAENRVCDAVYEARERGVKFDVGHGRANFSFAVAKTALEQGFLPDIISTDTTPATYLTGNTMNSMPFVLSKFLSMGMTLQQVIRCVTGIPAQMLGLSGAAGTLADGANADIVICKRVYRKIIFSDSAGTTFCGDQLLVPQMVIADGRMVYSRPGYGLVFPE